jgi:mono/diheme cytochrome c family protein
MEKHDVTNLSIRFARLSVAAVAAIMFAGAAAAQDANFGKSVWLSQANCADCHGILGDGNNEDPRSPRGANLWQTTLTADQLVEVILCGRPGTAMPYFDAKAYTDDRCYGATAEDLGDQVPTEGKAHLTQRHAKGLAAFILASFAGKGAPTQASCKELLGDDNPRCASLPAQ